MIAKTERNEIDIFPLDVFWSDWFSDGMIFAAGVRLWQSLKVFFFVYSQCKRISSHCSVVYRSFHSLEKTLAICHTKLPYPFSFAPPNSKCQIQRNFVSFQMALPILGRITQFDSRQTVIDEIAQLYFDYCIIILLYYILYNGIELRRIVQFFVYFYNFE